MTTTKELPAVLEVETRHVYRGDDAVDLVDLAPVVADAISESLTVTGDQYGVRVWLEGRVDGRPVRVDVTMFVSERDLLAMAGEINTVRDRLRAEASADYYHEAACDACGHDEEREP